MSRKLKLLAASSALGWIVAVPVLLTALVDPFLDFSGWPDGSLSGRAPASAQLARTHPAQPGPGGGDGRDGGAAPDGVPAPVPPRLVATVPQSTGGAAPRRREPRPGDGPSRPSPEGPGEPPAGGTGPGGGQEAGTPIGAPAPPAPAVAAPAPAPPAAQPPRDSDERPAEALHDRRQGREKAAAQHPPAHRAGGGPSKADGPPKRGATSPKHRKPDRRGADPRPPTGRDRGDATPPAQPDPGGATPPQSEPDDGGGSSHEPRDHKRPKGEEKAEHGRKDGGSERS